MTSLGCTRRTNALVAIVTLAMHVMVLPITRPLILPDESGFLLNARRLGTGGQPSGLDYFPGYSVVLAPLTALTTDLAELTRLVQGANAVLGASTALLAAALARRLFPTLTERHVALIGITVAAYPAYLLFSAFALSENLLVPWTLLLCLAFHRTTAHQITDRRAALDGVVFGLLAGLSLSIHTRALALPVASLLASAFVLRGRARAAAVLGLGSGSAAALVLVRYTLDTPVDSGALRSSPSSLISDTLSLRGALDVVTSAGGQLFYLMAATAGLAGYGAWTFVAAQKTNSSTDGAEGRRCVGMLVLLIFVASLGISSMFLAGREGDFAIYGRYAEGVLAPFLVAGLGSLALAPSLAAQRTRYLVFIAPLLAAALLVVRGPEAFAGRTLLLNIAGVFPVVDVVGSIRLSTITLFGVVFTIGLVAAARRRFEIGIGLLLIVFIPTGLFAIHRSAQAIDVLDQQDEMLDAIAEHGEECVALDIWQLGDRWHQENYRLRLNQQRFEYWSSATPDAPCSDLIISQRPDLDDVIPGATVVAVEPFGRQALWVTPGPLQDTLDASEDPTIANPLDSLPSDQMATVDVILSSTELEIGTVMDLSATIQNLGPLGFFPQDGFANSAGSVNLGLEFQLATEPGVRRHEPFRIRLPEPLGPGEQIVLSQVVRPEQIDPNLRPGTYVLVASLVQEGVGWTELNDAITVEVRG